MGREGQDIIAPEASPRSNSGERGMGRGGTRLVSCLAGRSKCLILILNINEKGDCMDIFEVAYHVFITCGAINNSTDASGEQMNGLKLQFRNAVANMLNNKYPRGLSGGMIVCLKLPELLFWRCRCFCSPSSIAHFSSQGTTHCTSALGVHIRHRKSISYTHLHCYAVHLLQLLQSKS